MPQMKPMNWIFLFLFFFMSMSLYFSNFPFLKSNTLVKKNTSIKMNSMKW